MFSPVHKAIVFNCNFNGLSIIQDLSARGVQCIAMDCARNIGTFTRYARFVRCPDPTEHEEAFIHFLYDFCVNESAKPVLFPTNDQWAMALARHKTRLMEVSIPCVADREVVEIVINKDAFYALGQECDFHTPRTWKFEQLQELIDSDYPIVAKPTSRRISSNTPAMQYHRSMDRLRLTVIPDREHLSRFLIEESEWLPDLTFQEYIEGLSDKMYTLGVYVDNKHVIQAKFSGRKVRGYPFDIGDCIVGENWSLPESVHDLTERIVRDLKLSGIAEFEYKLDAHNNTFTLIEVNPRSWSWIGITSSVGEGLPWAAYRDLTQIERNSEVGQGHIIAPDGAVRYVKVMEDALNSLLRYRFEHRP